MTPNPLHSIVDQCGSTITINQATGLMCIDGIPVCRVVTSPVGQVLLQFCDSNKVRSHYRGTRFIEIPVETLITKVKEKI